jgi:hypothetical protein
MITNVANRNLLRVTGLTTLMLFVSSDALGEPPFFYLYRNREAGNHIVTSSVTYDNNGTHTRWLEAHESYDIKGTFEFASFVVGESGSSADTGWFYRSVVCYIPRAKGMMTLLGGVKTATFSASVADVSGCDQDSVNIEPFTGSLTINVSLSNPTYYDTSRSSGTTTDLETASTYKVTCQWFDAQRYQNVAIHVNGDPWLLPGQIHVEATKNPCNLNTTTR